MDKTIGIKVCTALFAIWGLIQVNAMIGAMLEQELIAALVIFGLLTGVAMCAAAYGIWNLKNWGRMLGIMSGILVLILWWGLGEFLSLLDILIGVSVFIIIYFLLVDKNTKALFKGENG